MKIIVCGKPDILAAPNPGQSSHCCCHDLNADICHGAATFEEGGSQVLNAVLRAILH